MQETTNYHVPVLLNESIDLMITDPNGVYIDVTMGGGGHTRAILERLSPQGRLFSFDQDYDARKNAPMDDERFTFVHSNFAYLAHWMDYYGVDQVDGILADLGVSSHHFDDDQRGFSFRFDQAMPDMRMNQKAQLSARDLLMEYPEAELSRVLYRYGELKDANRLASLIVAGRESGYQRLSDLIEAVRRTLPKGGPQERNKLSRLFQALRIEVNDEMGVLSALLNAGKEKLRTGGRFSIISYHSLEDRMVKECFKNVDELNEREQIASMLVTQTKTFKSVTKKPIVPTNEEQARNNRSRSAKLRVAEKII